MEDLDGTLCRPRRTTPRTMWRMSASGCWLVGVAGLATASRRAQSVLDLVEVDLCFTIGGFAERDDPDFMFGLRVDDRDRNAREQSEHDEGLLSMGKPVVFEGVGGAVEHARSVDEIKPMGFQTTYQVYIRRVVASTVMTCQVYKVENGK